MTGLLERSLAAALLIGFLIVIRALLLHRLPKLTFQAAWAVVILRLLLPFSIPVFSSNVWPGVPSLSALLAENPDGGNGEDDVKQAAGTGDTRDAGGKGARNAGDGNVKTSGSKEARMGGNGDVKAADREPNRMRNDSDGKTKEKTDGETRAIRYRVLCGIWFAGMLFVLMYFLCSHFRARRIYAMALPAEHALPDVDFHGKWKALRRRVRIRVSDRISAPVTCGIVSPVILLPKTTDWDNLEQLRMVLEHEAVHIRRFDIVYKWLLAAAAAICRQCQNAGCVRPHAPAPCGAAPNCPSPSFSAAE